MTCNLTIIPSAIQVNCSCDRSRPGTKSLFVATQKSGTLGLVPPLSRQSLAERFARLVARIEVTIEVGTRT